MNVECRECGKRVFVGDAVPNGIDDADGKPAYLCRSCANSIMTDPPAETEYQRSARLSREQNHGSGWAPEDNLP
jgi:DNA-directed RNA polymerase subunit RPC12/RpoP